MQSTSSGWSLQGASTLINDAADRVVARPIWNNDHYDTIDWPLKETEKDEFRRNGNSLVWGVQTKVPRFDHNKYFSYMRYSTAGSFRSTIPFQSFLTAVVLQDLSNNTYTWLGYIHWQMDSASLVSNKEAKLTIKSGGNMYEKIIGSDGKARTILQIFQQSLKLKKQKDGTYTGWRFKFHTKLENKEQ